VTANGVEAAETWHQAPRRWGHPLHSVCSYMAMFPPSIPHTFIEWLTKPGDVVYDPFSGRGTTALEACLAGRIGYGSDLNPIACLLTSAKTNPPTWESIECRLKELETDIERLPVDGQAEVIRTIFAPGTLGELLWLREHLDVTEPTDAFLMSLLLGILHLNANTAGVPRGMSVSMPNTFAMAPGYVMRYVRDHDLQAPEVDVVGAIRDRATKYRQELTLPQTGRSWSQDASIAGWMEENNQRAKLIFSSPPYLHVIKYGKFNWIRLWMLGHEPADVDANLLATASLPKYLDFMSLVVSRLADVLTEDGRICLVIGDVSSGDDNLRLAEHVAASCVPAHLKVDGIVVDDLSVGRKVSRIWGSTKGKATKTDRILVLSRQGGPKLPTVPNVDWA